MVACGSKRGNGRHLYLKGERPTTGAASCVSNGSAIHHAHCYWSNSTGDACGRPLLSRQELCACAMLGEIAFVATQANLRKISSPQRVWHACAPDIAVEGDRSALTCMRVALTFTPNSVSGDASAILAYCCAASSSAESILAPTNEGTHMLCQWAHANAHTCMGAQERSPILPFKLPGLRERVHKERPRLFIVNRSVLLPAGSGRAADCGQVVVQSQVLKTVGLTLQA